MFRRHTCDAADQELPRNLHGAPHSGNVVNLGLEFRYTAHGRTLVLDGKLSVEQHRGWMADAGRPAASGCRPSMASICVRSLLQMADVEEHRTADAESTRSMSA